MGHTSFSFTLQVYGHWLDDQATDEARLRRAQRRTQTLIDIALAQHGRPDRWLCSGGVRVRSKRICGCLSVAPLQCSRSASCNNEYPMETESHIGDTGDLENPKCYGVVVIHPNGFRISEEHRCMNEAETRAREAAGSSGTVRIVYAD